MEQGTPAAEDATPTAEDEDMYESTDAGEENADEKMMALTASPSRPSSTCADAGHGVPGGMSLPADEAQSPKRPCTTSSPSSSRPSSTSSTQSPPRRPAVVAKESPEWIPGRCEAARMRERRRVKEGQAPELAPQTAREAPQTAREAHPPISSQGCGAGKSVANLRISALGWGRVYFRQILPPDQLQNPQDL